MIQKGAYLQDSLISYIFFSFESSYAILIHLSVCLLEAFVCMFVSLSVGISCPYVCLIVCWNLLSVCMSVCWNLLSVCLLEPFVYVHLSVCLLEPSVCMYVCLYLSECLSNSERIMCQHHLNNTFSVEYNTIL